MIQNLSADFAAEIKTKQDNLDVTQAHLRAATRELSEQRKQIQAWQARCSELDQVTQRIRNVEHALVDEEKFDWTGRTELDGGDAMGKAGPAFHRRGQNSTMFVDVSFNVNAEPTLPAGDSVTSLIRLRRMKMWHVRMEALVRQRLESLRGASAEREFQCKKIVALCTGVPVDKVEEVPEFLTDVYLLFLDWLTYWFLVQMLDDLLVAVESETQVVDIGRVSGFMQKVSPVTGAETISLN
jgi:regulatory protein SWI6